MGGSHVATTSRRWRSHHLPEILERRLPMVRRSCAAERPGPRGGAAGPWGSPESPAGPVLAPDAASQGRAGLGLPARAELRGRVCGPAVPAPAHRGGPDSSRVQLQPHGFTFFSASLVSRALVIMPHWLYLTNRHVNDWRVRPSLPKNRRVACCRVMGTAGESCARERWWERRDNSFERSKPVAVGVPAYGRDHREAGLKSGPQTVQRSGHSNWTGQG